MQSLRRNVCGHRLRLRAVDVYNGECGARAGLLVTAGRRSEATVAIVNLTHIITSSVKRLCSNARAGNDTSDSRRKFLHAR